jgi:hypothetical protein
MSNQKRNTKLTEKARKKFDLVDASGKLKSFCSQLALAWVELRFNVNFEKRFCYNDVGWNWKFDRIRPLIKSP